MTKRSSKRVSSRTEPSLTAEERIRGIVKKLRAIEDDHQASGGTLIEWNEALRCLAEEPGTDSLSSPRFEELGTLATLLEAWHADSRFLDVGKPRSLATAGRAQFSDLCRSIGEGRKAKTLLDVGLSLGVLGRTRDGLIAPTHRSALVRRPSPMLFEMMSVGLAAWQATVRHNVDPARRDDERRLDRGVYHQAIPAKLEQEYHRFARREFTAPINNLDNWLQAHRASADEPEVVFVCAHAFAGTEEQRTPAGQRRRRGHR